MKDWGLDQDKLTISGISSVEWNRIAGIIENTVADHTDLLHGDGCRSGWRLYADKTVGAGEGWLSGGHGRTVGKQAIEGLTLGCINFVFAQATFNTPNRAEVRFVANPIGVAYGENYGGAFLGTLMVDGTGTVTHINDIAVALPYEEHVNKQWTRRLQFEMVDIPSFSLTIPGLEQTIITVPHPTKRFRGAGTLHVYTEPDAAQCAWTADLSLKDRIKLLAINLTNYAGRFDWVLRREALAE